MCIFLCIAPIFQKRANSFGKNGGDDETRTRDLYRDRRAIHHWRTQNQQVRRALVGTRWCCRAGLVRFC
jgi:hypothetical protein